MPYCIFLHNFLCRISHLILNRRGEIKHLCLIPKVKVFSSSSFNMLIDFFISFIILRKVLSIPCFVDCFYHERIFILLFFSESFETICVIFVLYSINVYYTDWFSYTKLTLHSCPHLKYFLIPLWYFLTFSFLRSVFNFQVFVNSQVCSCYWFLISFHYGWGTYFGWYQ